MNVSYLIVYSFKTFFRVKGALLSMMAFLGFMYLIEGSFWNVFYASEGAKLEYSSSELIAYIFSALAFSQIVAVTGRQDTLSFDIESGDIAADLLKPVHPLNALMLMQIGQTTAIGCLIIPFVASLNAWWGTLDYTNLLWIPFLVLGASTLNFFINFLLATCTFYWRDSYALISFKETLSWVLTGTLIPLDLFPDAVQDAIQYFPPAYVVYFPVKSLQGAFDPIHIIATQLALGAVLYVLCRIWWQIAVRHHQAYGG